MRYLPLLCLLAVGCELPQPTPRPRINEAAAIVAGVLLMDGEEESGAIKPDVVESKPFLLQTCFGQLRLEREPNVGDVIAGESGRRWRVESKPPGNWVLRELVE